MALASRNQDKVMLPAYASVMLVAHCAIAQICGIILENTFTSIDDLVRLLDLSTKSQSSLTTGGDVCGQVRVEARLLVPARLHVLLLDKVRTVLFLSCVAVYACLALAYSHWPNADYIRTLRVPVLFMSGLQDELIPPGSWRFAHSRWLTLARFPPLQSKCKSCMIWPRSPNIDRCVTRCNRTSDVC